MAVACNMQITPENLRVQYFYNAILRIRKHESCLQEFAWTFASRLHATKRLQACNVLAYEQYYTQVARVLVCTLHGLLHAVKALIVPKNQVVVYMSINRKYQPTTILLLYTTIHCRKIVRRPPHKWHLHEHEMPS